MDLATIKGYFPHCRTVDNNGRYIIYADPDSIFHFQVISNPSESKCYGHRFDIHVPDGYYTMTVTAKYNTADPAIVLAYLSDVLENGDDRREMPNIVFTKKDPDDIRLVVDAVYQAYALMITSMLQEFEEEDSDLSEVEISIVLNQEKLAKYAEKLLSFFPATGSSAGLA